MSVMRWMLAATLAVGSVAPAAAEQFSPVGRWKSATGESHYDVSLCGDGTQLCAKLVWLRDDALSDETEPYLGTYLIENADAVAQNTWQGEVHIFDQTLGGTITVVDPRTISLQGCYLVVICKSFELKKMKAR